MEHEFDHLTAHGHPSLCIGLRTPEPVQLNMPTFVTRIRQMEYSVTYVEDAGIHYLTVQRATVGLNWLAKSWQWT